MSMAGERHLVITGATSGIGAACARLAVARGWCVTGIGRRRERLADLAGELGDGFRAQVGDVTDPDSLSAAVLAGAAVFGPVAGLIANAGRNCDGELLELSSDDLAGVMDVNYLGVHRSVRAVWPQRARGLRITILSSVVSRLTVPRMGAYCATKHAVDAYAAALRMELAAEGVHVATVNPGTVHTEFFDHHGPGRAWTWRPGTALAPERVARVALRTIEGRRRRRVILPLAGRLAAAAFLHTTGLIERILRGRLAAMRRDEAIGERPVRANPSDPTEPSR